MVKDMSKTWSSQVPRREKLKQELDSLTEHEDTINQSFTVTVLNSDGTLKKAEARIKSHAVPSVNINQSKLGSDVTPSMQKSFDNRPGSEL